MRIIPVLLVASLALGETISSGFKFSEEQFLRTEHDGYMLLTGNGLDVTDVPGAPQLPVKAVTVELPGRGAVKSVHVQAERWERLETGVRVLPAQKQVILSRLDAVDALTGPDPAIYESWSAWPAEPWVWTGTGIRSGKTVAEILLYPVRYVGAEGRLEYCPNFRIEVEYEPLPPLPQLDLDAFDYVIVTATTYDSIFRRLADWKTQKGVQTVIRHIDWVYSNYTGRDNAEKLRNYLKTLPDSGVRYVLLGGDVSVIPFRKAYAMTSEGNIHPREDSLPCDLYFADLDGDWDRNGNNVFGELADSVDLYPDLVVGRAPVDSRQDAQAFVNKVLEYECGPAETRQTNVAFFAEVMWSNPYTDGGRHKDKLEAAAFSSGYTVTKKYQRLGNESRTSVMAAIRDGQNYLNHDGHGWIDVMSVGGYPNYLRTRDADTITNAYRGVIYSIGCWTTAFDTVSIGEAFVTNPNGGTVATIGNSSYGWGSPGNPGFGYSDKFDDRFWWTVQHTDDYRVGEALAKSKAYFAPFSRGENVYRWHQYQVNLMGCPEMPIWTRTPETLEVTAPAEIPSGAGRVLVIVSCHGRSVRGALVCLMKQGESYSTAITGPDGSAWLQVEPHSSGNFLLTVTAHNFLPLQKAIGTSSGPYVNFAGWIVNDSLGNRDGVVNSGETVFLPVWLHNAGSAASAGVLLKLRSSDPVVTILDSTASAEALQPGDSVLIPDAFQVAIGACSQDGKLLAFEFVVEDTDMPRKFYPVLQLGAPVLEFVSYAYLNPPGLPGQTKGVKVAVANQGHGFGHGTWARLVSLDPNVTVLAPDSVLLGELAPGCLKASADSFSVSISGACPGSYLAAVRLDLWCETYTFNHSFQLLVGDYGFADDMEAGPSKWTHGGTGDRWHISNRRFHSPGQSWYCGDESSGRYYDNMNAWLTTVPFMVAENCSLRFWRWFSVPNYGVDGIYVIIVRKTGADTLDFIGTGGALREKSDTRYQIPSTRSADEERNSTLAPLNHRPLEPFLDGIESDWFEEKYDLGALAVGETIQVKIAFKSDGDGDYGEGFYIDDLAVAGGNLPPTFLSEPSWPTAYGLRLLAFPNPFRSVVTLQLAAAGPREISIFDASGRCVRSMAVNGKPAAFSSVTWNGLDDSGRRVAAGTYFVRAQSGGEIWLAKVLLAR